MALNLGVFDSVVPTTKLDRVIRTWTAADITGRQGDAVRAHSIRAAAIAHVICMELHAQRRIPEWSVLGALLHDVFKLRQLKVIISNPSNLMAFLDTLSVNQGRFLTARGGNASIVNAASAAGHEILPRFIRRPSSIPLECRIVFYADLVVSNGGFVTLIDRIASARERYARIDVEGQTFYHLDDRTYTVLERFADAVENDFAHCVNLTRQAFHAMIVDGAEHFLAHAGHRLSRSSP